MDQIMALDPYVVAGLSMTFVLTVCVGILFLLRDPKSAPPRIVARAVWCASRRQIGMVDFVECTQTGLTFRSVQHCSLRGAGGHCDEACCDVEAEEARPTYPAPVAHPLPASA